MTLLTFLGTGNYRPTTYRPCDFSSLHPLEEPGEISTTYFSVALARWVRPERIVIVTTPEASARHREPLSRELADFSQQFLELPLQAGTESDLWSYFQLLTDQLHDCEELIADITHGFRSTPVVTLLALSYLRVTNGLAVRGLYYGAFDAVPFEEPVKPTFDLSPFLELFQWTSAADSFLHTGDATRLGELIHSAQQSLWTDSTRSKHENPRSLSSLAKAITESSANLRLLRLQDLGPSLDQLGKLHGLAHEEIARFLPPFARLIKMVTEDLTQHRAAALTPSGDGTKDPPDQTDLRSQLALIAWLRQRGHTSAALTLAREWLVTCLACHLVPTPPLPLVYSQRMRFETILTHQTSPRAGSRGRLPERDLFEAYQNLPADLTAKFETLWSQTTQPRNDLNHANHNDKSHKSTALARTVGQLLDSFPDLLP